eukprot:gene6902-7680_t
MTIWSKEIHISSKEGEDNEACGSTLSPCFSLQQAIHQANWNDVIILPSNPSREWQADTCNRSHVIQRNVTIIEWHKTKTAIDCIDKERERAFLLIQSTDEGYVNVIIEHLELRNLTRSNGIKLEGASIMARNCLFLNISEIYLRNVILADDTYSNYSSSLIIRECIFQRYQRAISFLPSKKIKMHIFSSKFLGTKNQVCISVDTSLHNVVDSIDIRIHDSIFAWSFRIISITLDARFANVELKNVVIRDTLIGIDLYATPILNSKLNVQMYNTRFYNISRTAISFKASSVMEIDRYLGQPSSFNALVFNTTIDGCSSTIAALYMNLRSFQSSVKFIHCRFKFTKIPSCYDWGICAMQPNQIMLFLNGNYLFQDSTIDVDFEHPLTGTIASNSHLTMKNVAVYGKPPLMSLSGETLLINTSVYSSQGADLMVFEYVGGYYGGIRKGIKMENLVFHCPNGSIVKSFSRTNLELDLEHALDKLIYYCKPCPATTYTLQAGSERRSNEKIETRNPTCKECSYGATCNQGIHANPNYFGIHYSAKLKFTICPKGYCCKKNCTGLQTCAEGRRGTLCGRCKQGYSENVIDTHCTKEEDCNKWWISLIVLLTAILYVCVFLYLQEIIRNIYLLLSVWKSSKGDSSDVPKDSGCGLDGKNGAASISSLIKVVLYFYQLQFFINVTGVTKLDETKEKLREIISNALNFQPSHHIISGCPFKGLTPVTKKLYITQFNIFIYLVLCALYVSTKVKARLAIGRENNAFTTRLCKAITTLMLINTASLANTSLALLNCVNLGPNNVLFIDGEITCFQPWQYIVMAYFLLFVLPVSIILMCGARLLQENRISATQFIVSMAFPFIFPCFITKCSRKRVCDTDHNMDEHTLGLTEENECLMGSEDESDETESNIVSGHLRRRNATDNDVVADGNDDDLCDNLVSDSSTRNNFIEADKDLVTSSARNSVMEVLTKPFERPDGSGRIHWEGILLIRRLGVVCCSTMITNEVIRLYVLLLWLVVSLLHHLWVQPFRKRSVNMADGLSLTVLCLLCAINLFFAHYIMDGNQLQDVDISIAVVFEWVIFIVTIAVPLCLTLAIALALMFRCFYGLYSLTCSLCRLCFRKRRQNRNLSEPFL